MEQGNKDQPKTISPEDRYKCEFRREKITEMINTIDSIIDSFSEAKAMEVTCKNDFPYGDSFRETPLALKKAVSVVKNVEIDGKKVRAKAILGTPEWNKEWESMRMDPDMDLRYFSLKLPGADEYKIEHFFIIGENKNELNPLGSFYVKIIKGGDDKWEVFGEHVDNAEPLLDIIKQFAE